MAKYTKKDLDRKNKLYKKTFKESGCRVLMDDEMLNIEESMSVLNSTDVKIIEASKNGDYSEFNSVSPFIRNYIGTLAIKKLTSETGVALDQLSVNNLQIKKYIQNHALDAGFRVGLTALKQTYPDNINFKEMDEYANEYLLSKTLSLPSKEKVDALNTHLGQVKANNEINKNLSKQVVLAKVLFMAQLGKYDLQENGETINYKGSIAETFAHGGRTNFILPHNDAKNEVLKAFDGGEIGKTAEVHSRIAATHSATQRKVNLDLSIQNESVEEKPKFTDVGKIFSNQYGMDVAIGGIGEIGPNKKPILADGSAGHMYIRKQTGNENTCGSLLVGIESAASLKTSHTGHFHTPLAKSSKQSAFLSDKFGPGSKTNGKVVDLSGLDAEKLAAVLKEFEKGYMSLQQSSNSTKLNELNEMLSGKRLSQNELVNLMTQYLEMKKDFASEVVDDARKGLSVQVQKETSNLIKQFKDVLRVDFNNKLETSSVKVMQKNADDKWELTNLFSSTETTEQRFQKFWKSVQNGNQIYLASKSKFNPIKINVNGRNLSVGERAEKLNLNKPKEPSKFQKALHKITNGLLFASSIKQYEINLSNYEQQQAMNSFIDEHKIVVEQNQRAMRLDESQSLLRDMLAKTLESNKNIEKSSAVKQPISKGKTTIEL